MPRCYRCGKSEATMKVVCDDCAAENAAKDAAKDAEIERLTKQATISAFIKYALKRSCEELVEAEADLSHVAIERDAMEADLNGICWACVDAKPATIGAGGLVVCKYMQERGILGVAGRGGKKCDHWRYRGPKAGRQDHGE